MIITCIQSASLLVFQWFLIYIWNIIEKIEGKILEKGSKENRKINSSNFKNRQ